MDLSDLENNELHNYKGTNSDEGIFLYENHHEIYNDTNYVMSIETWLH